MTSKRTAIAYCADRAMRVPLHVSLLSLLKHLDTEVYLYFLIHDFTEWQKDVLVKEASASKFVADVVFLDSDLELFSGLPALSGSMSVYDRLLLPDLVKEERLLYIDADTLVQSKLTDLLEMELGGSPLAASIDGSVEWSLDKRFRLQLGHALTDGEFNSGVLLMNARAWRKRNLLKECLEFGRRYAQEILAVDQTILNCVFNGQVVNFPKRFNSCFKDAAIRHFIGSPKPWDAGGRWLVDGADSWYKMLSHTNLSRIDKWIRPQDWYRLPKILGGYKNIIRKKLNHRSF